MVEGLYGLRPEVKATIIVATSLSFSGQGSPNPFSAHSYFSRLNSPLGAIGCDLM